MKGRKCKDDDGVSCDQHYRHGLKMMDNSIKNTNIGMIGIWVCVVKVVCYNFHGRNFSKGVKL